MGLWWHTLAYLCLPPDHIQPVSAPCVSVHMGESMRVTHCTIECVWERQREMWMVDLCCGCRWIHILALTQVLPIQHIILAWTYCHCGFYCWSWHLHALVNDPSKHQTIQVLLYFTHRHSLLLIRPPVRWRHDGIYMMSPHVHHTNKRVMLLALIQSVYTHTLWRGLIRQH